MRAKCRAPFACRKRVSQVPVVDPSFWSTEAASHCVLMPTSPRLALPVIASLQMTLDSLH